MGGIPDQFLFINKTAKSSSLSHSRPVEKFNIYSHAQSKSHKSRKRCGDNSSRGRDPPFAISSSRLAPENCVSRLSSGRVSEAKDRQLESAVPSPRAQLNEDAVDPFFCSSTIIDAKDQALLYYPFISFLETTFKAESLSDFKIKTDFRHRQAVTERLQRCVVSELILYTTLAYSASCMRWTVGESDPERPAELYILKAIKALQRRLEQSVAVDSWLILSIYALAVSEMWALQFDAATTHLKMMCHFVEKFGGLSALDPYLMESILLCDKYVAIGRFEPSILPLDWEPSPLPRVKMTKIKAHASRTIPNIAQGFFGLVEDVLGAELSRIIRDIVTCIQVAEYLSTESSRDTDEQRWLFLRHQALTSRLISLQPRTPIQYCTRIALIVWLLKITAYFGAQRWSKNLLPRLKAAIIRISDRNEWIPSTLLFWMTCLGAMTAEYTEERDWFLARTYELARSLDIVIEKQSFRRLLQKYLFIGSEDGLQFFRMVRAVRELATEVQ